VSIYLSVFRSHSQLTLCPVRRHACGMFSPVMRLHRMRINNHISSKRFARIVFPMAALVTLLWRPLAPLIAQTPSKDTEWKVYWGDNKSSKYSPLDQINRDNVKNLKIAWRWASLNLGPKADFNWEATPIMVGGVLYVTAGSRRDVVAIDPVTGETLWIYRL